MPKNIIILQHEMRNKVLTYGNKERQIEAPGQKLGAFQVDAMTDKEAKGFYNSSAWKLKRMQILERDHYECQDCRKRLKDAVAAGVALRGEERKNL